MKSWGVGVLRVQILGDVFIPVFSNGTWSLSQSAFQTIDGILERSKKAGLRAILDLHMQSVYFPDPQTGPAALAGWRDEANIQKLSDVWHSLARRYRDERSVIAGFDLLNEPHPPDTADGYAAWNAITKRVTTMIRQVDSYHTLVVESCGFADASKFFWLEPTGDSNTVYSFHFYRPHEFTEQGTRTNWPFGADGVSGYTYPENVYLGWDIKTLTFVDRNYLEEGLVPVLQFQKKYKARIWVGEFSALRWAAYAPDDMKHNGTYYYIKDCLEMFTREGWDWTYHGYLDSPGGAWSPEHSTDRSDNKLYASTDRLDLLKTYWK